MARDDNVWYSARIFPLLLAACLVLCAAARADDRAGAVRALIERGRYAEAAARARAFAETVDARDPRSIPARQLLIEALLLDGRGAQPETLNAARALVSAPLVPATSPARGTSERLLGLVEMEAGAYAVAARHIARALELHERALGPRHAEVADDLDALTEVRIWQEDYRGALVASDRALAIREDARASAAAELARTLELRGLMWQRRSEVLLAHTELARALTLREAAGSTHPTLVRVLTLSGDQLKLENKLPDAAAVLRRAVAIAEASLRDGHPETANALRTLASVLQYVESDHGAVKRLRERALAIAEAAYGPVHPVVAMQLNDLATSCETLGDFGSSRRLMRQSLAIYEKVLGPSHRGVMIATCNLGNRYVAIGDYDEALRLFRRAERTWARVAGPRDRLMALALGGLGETLSKMHRDREALVYLERARVLWETDPPNRLRLSDTLVLLAGSWSRLGDHRRAADAVARALRIREEEDGADNVAEALLVASRVSAAGGDYAAAVANAERGLAVAVPVFGASHPKVGAIQAALAVALLGVDDTANALAAALEAERIGREHLQGTIGYLPERQALAYVNARPQGLDVALSAIAASPSVAPILDAVIRSRSLTLDEMAERRRSRGPGRALPLRTALADATERLVGLAVRGPGRQTPQQYQALLDRTRQDREHAETALADADADIRSAIERREIGIRDVRAVLPAGSGLISFVRYEHIHTAGSVAQRDSSGGATLRETPEYLAFVQRGGDTDAAVVSIGDARALDAIIASWRREVVGTIGAGGMPAPGAERRASRAGALLRQRIWDPLAGHLGGVDQVFVVPDGAINLLPLAALPVDATRYLVDVGPTIHYLSAERDLIAPASEPGPRAKGLLAVGGPAYGPLPAGVIARVAGGRREVPCASFESMEFHPLPAARSEADDISAMWRSLGGSSGVDTGTVVLTGSRASETAFKRDAPGKLYLHLATHGFFLGNNCDDTVYTGRGPDGLRGIGGRKGPKRQRILPDNPLLLSGLALAGANQRRPTRTNPEDGILTAEEVASMDLDGVEWAVLSACDTGVGEIKAGEGVFGLRRAFRIAGARTIIMSLWAVEDRAARAWMRPLYEGRLRDRLSTAEAVRHASQAVLAERRAKKLSTHPFYWAGFVAAGDWR